MPRYEDCLSCAFYQQEEAICDFCDEADQWEPGEELDFKSGDITSQHVISRHYILKKAA